MALEIPLMDIAFTSNNDYSSTGQYMFVKVSGAFAVGTCSATTDTPIGVLQNKPGSAQSAAVRVQGVSKLLAGGALTAGNFVGTDATSRGTVVAANGTAAYTVGITLDTPAAAAEFLTLFITHAGRGA